MLCWTLFITLLTSFLPLFAQAWEPDYILRVSEGTIYSDCAPRHSVLVNGQSSLSPVIVLGGAELPKVHLLVLCLGLQRESTIGFESTMIWNTKTPLFTGTDSPNSSHHSATVPLRSRDGPSHLVSFILSCPVRIMSS